MIGFDGDSDSHGSDEDDTAKMVRMTIKNKNDYGHGDGNGGDGGCTAWGRHPANSAKLGCGRNKSLMTTMTRDGDGGDDRDDDPVHGYRDENDHHGHDDDDARLRDHCHKLAAPSCF